MISKLRRLEKTSFQVMVAVVSFLVLALLVLVAAQIVARQFGIRAIAPPDEIVTLIFTWMVFLGSALLVRDYSHLRVEAIDSLFVKHPDWRKYYNLVTGVMVMIFLVAMTKSGFRIVSVTGSKTSPMLALPQRLWYLSLPISSVMMVIYLVIRISADWLENSGE